MGIGIVVREKLDDWVHKTNLYAYWKQIYMLTVCNYYFRQNTPLKSIAQYSNFSLNIKCVTKYKLYLFNSNFVIHWI